METNFANVLSASMGECSVEDYVKISEECLAKLDTLRKMADNLSVKNLEDYKRGMELKRLLSSLFCYAANNDKNWEEVSDVEGIVGKKLFDFVEKHVITDTKVKTVCRYLLWGRYYYDQNNERIYQFLKEHDVLRKSGSWFYIIGLHCKIGDNTFTVDKNNKEHRNYIRSCVLQAIAIKNSCFEKFLEEKRNEIPELEEIYDKVSVCDGKFCIRNIGLKRREKNLILGEFCGK